MARYVPMQPRAIEMQYYRDLLEIDRAAVQTLRQNISQVDGIAGLRMDADVDEWSFVRAIRVAVDGAVATVSGRLTLRYDQLSHFNWVQWARDVKRSAGREIPEIRPWSEPQIDAMSRKWIADNTSLIRQVADDGIMAPLNDTVLNAVRRGLSKEQLKKQLMDKAFQDGLGSGRFNDYATRADLIATDQILKANSDLTNQRQINAGVSYYRWRGVLDNRERHTHVLLEGMYFRVDGQPMTAADYKALKIAPQPYNHPSEAGEPAGAPGRAVRCRCHAETVFKGTPFDIGEEDNED